MRELVRDTALYVCVLLVPPNILDTESTQSTIAIRENQNISLTCKAEGFPTPKIMWRREDGQGISVERKKKGESKDKDVDVRDVGCERRV